MSFDPTLSLESMMWRLTTICEQSGLKVDVTMVQKSSVLLHG